MLITVDKMTETADRVQTVHIVVYYYCNLLLLNISTNIRDQPICVSISHIYRAYKNVDLHTRLITI